MRPSTSRGFTLLEMAVTLLIIGVLAALAFDSMRRARPRATLDSTSAELQSAVHAARQQALALATRVGVLVFPGYANGEGKGRIIVLQDEPDDSLNPSFFSNAAPLNFGNYDPSVLAATPGGQVVATIDLPHGVEVGPAAGYGQAIPFPYDSITTVLDCSFCDAGGDRRGAIVFDARGRPRFFSATGAAGSIQLSGQAGGASFSIYGTDLKVGGKYTTSTLVITAPQGMVRTFHNG